MRKKQTRIKPGEIYGKIQIVDENREKSYKRWNCICLNCDTKFIISGQEIFRYQNLGCPNCRKNIADRERLEDYREKYIGQKFGQLEILEITRLKKYNGSNRPFALCRCDCGAEKEILLAKIIAGQAKTCGHDTAKNLKMGHDIVKKSSKNGTSVITIDGRRKTNKNSSTHLTGVSYEKRSGKYRAYINFRRKQYHLGLFDNIDDAAAARKIAERKIYGDFLEWYRNQYPEYWETIERKNNS